MYLQCTHNIRYSVFFFFWETTVSILIESFRWVIDVSVINIIQQTSVNCLHCRFQLNATWLPEWQAGVLLNWSDFDLVSLHLSKLYELSYAKWNSQLNLLWLEQRIFFYILGPISKTGIVLQPYRILETVYLLWYDISQFTFSTTENTLCIFSVINIHYLGILCTVWVVYT